MHTRRDFLLAGLTAAGLVRAQEVIDCGATQAGATQYVPPAAAVLPRMRLSDFVTSPAWPQFVAAHQRLKDQHRFAALADWHYSCCRAAGGTDVHGTVFFLPWHRIAVHLYERALYEAAGLPALRLPYWQWQTDLGVPPQYETTAALQPVNKHDLTIPRVNVLPTVSWQAPALSTAGLLTLPSFQDLSIQATQNAHTWVHQWSGFTMANITNSPRDPLFFTHHANMDRLWFQWKQQHPGPCPAAIAGNKIYFKDLDGLPRFITIGAMWDEGSLGYSYPAPEQPAFTLVSEELTNSTSAVNFLPDPAVETNPKEFLEFVEVDLRAFHPERHKASFYVILLEPATGTPRHLPVLTQLAILQTHHLRETISFTTPVSDIRALDPKARFRIARASSLGVQHRGSKVLQARRINRLTLKPPA